MPNSISTEIIAAKILIIRGKRVMIDTDLALLYGVKTKRLNEQVRRNKKRFPEDFMFQLTREETLNLKSQIATSSWGGIRKLPCVFTQEGVAMLSGVLNSERAIQVNIQIMRTFTKIRRMILTNQDLKRKIEEIEKKYDKQFSVVFEVIKQLLAPDKKEDRKVIGFRA